MADSAVIVEAAIKALGDAQGLAALGNLVLDRGDPQLVESAALFSRLVAETAGQAANAWFLLAIAAALSGDAEDAGTQVHEARRLAPDEASGWIVRAAALGRTHPAVLDLIPALTAPLPDPEPEDA